MGKHKVHRSETWKRNTLLFTCILRLRVQPSVPYPIIVFFLINDFLEITQKLAKKIAPRDLRPILAEDENALREWLEGYLDERYNLAEDWCFQPWQTARDWEADKVEAILGTLELDKMGYVVRDEEEMRVQLEWRNKGDWKKGSEPQGREARPKAYIVYSIQENVPEAARTFHGEKQHACAEQWNTDALPALTAFENVPQLPTTYLKERGTGWAQTQGPGIEKVPDNFDDSINDLLRPLGWTLGAEKVPEPRTGHMAIESQQLSLESELERRRWTQHRERIDSLVQRLEVVQQKYRDAPQVLHYKLETQQESTAALPINEHLFRPRLPRIQTSFDQQLEDIEKLEQLIHKHSISEDTYSPASVVSQHDAKQGRTLSAVTGYGGDCHWVEMGSPA